jgi:predicted dehydrogenase
MKQAIDDGTLGDVHQLTFRLRTGDGQGPDAYLDRQPYFQGMNKFLIRETGVHWIDTFKYLLGKPTAVFADLRKLNPVIAGEDAGYFIMEFERGKRALFDANRHLDHDAENCRNTLGEALLEGTKSTITLSGTGELKIRKFGSREYETLLPAQSWAGFAGDCVHALQSHVIDRIHDGGEFENSAADYLSVLKLEAAIYQSARTGQKVKV